MTTLDERERAYEKKFAQDEELRFRCVARRNRMLGVWAASQLGKSGDEADAYAKEVVRADFEEPGDEDVFRKVRRDFDAASVPISDEQIRKTMREMLIAAAEQLSSS